MAGNKDWLPKTREKQLEMTRDWQSVLAVKGDAWGVPQSVSTEFGTLVASADSALAAAVNETTRTPVATAQCREAFNALDDKMRDMKRRYFLCPPLTEADLISLGLKPRDEIQTPSHTPTAQTTVETYLVGRHELGIRIIYVTGSPDDPANKGYRIWYRVVTPEDTPPAGPGDLHKSFYTQRRKDLIEFDYADSGKTAYFAVQVENVGKQGPWGPLVSALIP
jgi:hypothetical protein